MITFFLIFRRPIIAGWGRYMGTILWRIRNLIRICGWRLDRLVDLIKIRFTGSPTLRPRTCGRPVRSVSTVGSSQSVSSTQSKEFVLYLFEIPLVDPLTLTIVLSLFNLFIINTSQSSLQHQYHFIIYNLYNSPSCGSTPVLPGSLLLQHSCTWVRHQSFGRVTWPCDHEVRINNGLTRLKNS